MDNNEKIRRCAVQLLHGKAFLKAYQEDLFCLYKDTAFRSLMDEIEYGQNEDTVFPVCFSDNRDFKTDVLSGFFYQNNLYSRFPAYRSIIDQMVQLGEYKLSGTISVFYAMKYWEAMEQVKKGVEPEIVQPSDADYRQKWKQEYRCEDGHYVRSKNEQLVDNWLYHHNIVHAYEKLVIDKATGKEYISDFFLPVLNVYIEIWGYESDEYLQRKEAKQSVYQKNGLRLINMTDAEVKVLDDFLMRQLRIQD